MTDTNWYGKPYYSLDAYLKNTYNYKCYKVSLNTRMTCPNRDGTLGNRGCIFCSAGGSGDFAVEVGGGSNPADGDCLNPIACFDIARQLEEGIQLIERKLTSGAPVADSFPDINQNEKVPTSNIIAYFQA